MLQISSMWKVAPPKKKKKKKIGLMQSLLDFKFVYVNHEFEINHLYDPSPSQNPAATLECTFNSA